MGHMWTSTKFINQTMNLRKLSPAARGLITRYGRGYSEWILFFTPLPPSLRNALHGQGV